MASYSISVHAAGEKDAAYGKKRPVGPRRTSSILLWVSGAPLHVCPPTHLPMVPISTRKLRSQLKSR
jgi:hypothetical protein